MKTLSIAEAAYIAGIIDGEGSVIVTRVKRPENRSGYRYYSACSVVSTCREVLDWLTSATGLGKSIPKKESSIKAKRKCWTWYIKHQEVKEFLEQILPYMIIKKDSAQNCIDFCKASINRGNYGKYDLDKMEYFWRESSRLNGRGEYLDPLDPPKSTQGRAMAEMRSYEKGAQSMTFQEVMIKFAQINGHYPREGEYEVPSECPALN